MLLFAGLVFGGVLFSQAQKDGEPKKPVDISADFASRTPELPEGAIAMVGNVVFHHNGAVISCDSAVKYSENRIDCFKNVIINKDSTFVYGDRAEYNGEVNMARVYSPVVKVVDGDATLYTYNFSFNTRDNIGTWFGGGVLYQQDNTMESEKGYYYSDLHELVAVRDVEMKNDSHQIVSDSVRYNTETKVASFYTRTYIWTKEGEMIRAERGRYNTRDSTYFFYDNAYVLTEFRETWADTIDFNARFEDAILQGNIQIDDREHDSSAFGDWGQYWGEKGETMLTLRPSLLNYNADQGNSDTLYMRADTIFMFVRYPSEGRMRDSIAGEVDAYAHLRWTDSLPDSVKVSMADSLAPVIAGLRGEITTLGCRADSIMNALYPPVAPVVDTLPPADSLPPVPEPERTEIPEVLALRARAAELAAEADSLQTARDYLRPKPAGGAEVSARDSLAMSRADSLARADSLVRADSLLRADPKAFRAYEKALKKAEKDERRRLKAEVRAAKKAERQRIREEKRAAKAAIKAEKLAERRRRVTAKRGWVTETPWSDSIARADSIARLDSLMPAIIDSLEMLPPPEEPAAEADTTIRIFRGWYDVKIWRKDMQAVCDSIVGFSADSTIHMYTDPILWHSNSQIVADSMTLYTAGEEIERAEFFGNPIMGSQLGEVVAKQFNQVTGQAMTSWFRESAVYRHDTNGNAQAFYYVQEDDHPDPVAFLVMSASEISFLIADQFVDYIIPRRVVEYTVYPMDQIPPAQATELKGFRWWIERLPNKEDVFDRGVRPSERVSHEALERPVFPIAARIDRRREYLVENRMWADRTDPLPPHAVEFRRDKTGQ